MSVIATTVLLGAALSIPYHFIVVRALDLDPADCRKYAESRSWTRSTEQFVSNLAPRTGAECKLSNQYQT